MSGQRIRTFRKSIPQSGICICLNMVWNKLNCSYADATTAPVAVMVEDVNDNPPQFVSTSLTASVSEEAEFGTIVTTIMVGMKSI